MSLLDGGSVGQRCGSCGRPVVVPEEEDIRDIEARAKFGGVLRGPLGIMRCSLCHETEKRLEAYLLVGGIKARAFVLELLAKTERAVDGKYPPR